MLKSISNSVLNSFPQNPTTKTTMTSTCESFSSPPSPPSKRRKTQKIDRISTLPDTILLHILSFLSTTDTVSTGVLSKRWRNLWTLTPDLLLCYYDDRPLKMDDKNIDFSLFVDFLSSVFIHHKSPNIRSFKLVTPYNDELEPHVTKWVRHVITKGVEKLGLVLDYHERLPLSDLSQALNLPHQFYHTKSLIKLSLQYCNFAPPRSSVSWPCLRTLKLTESLITEDGIRAILLGTPCLENFVLGNCVGFSSIDTSCSNSLKSLGVHGFSNGGPENMMVEIYAPNVWSLTLEGGTNLYEVVYVKLMNMSSLKKASVCIYSPYQDIVPVYTRYRSMVVELLRDLSHVDRLTIGHPCIQALSTTDLNDASFTFLSWKCLTIHSNLGGWEVLAISALLNSSPKLEYLLIDTTQAIKDKVNFCAGLPRHIGLHEPPHSYLKCLKSVDIFYSKKKDHYELGSVMSFAEFLLSNAKSLKVTINKKY